MIPSTITLTVTQGMFQGKEYVFDGPSLCVIGRSSACDLQVPNDAIHADISRRHCLLEIDPPTIRVHDLNSRNGTFVNGVRIPGPADTHGDGSDVCGPASGCDLKDGDEVRLGNFRFSVTLNNVGTPAVPLLFV
jgi:pSer/pThr/pTyr-binding forkhead associated (FHA) protein